MRAVIAIAAVMVAVVSANPALAQTPQRASERFTTQGPMTGSAMATIASTIVRQLQPCADRQIIPAPEASQIATVVRIHLNRDGSLADLKIMEHQGVTDANARFIPRVDQAVQAIFAGCTPFQGLPPELYDVPHGWRQMTFRYRLEK